MTVGAVVVHWNSLGHLPGCLESLAAQGAMPIVVVDNDSPDDGQAEIAAAFPAVRWSRQPRNLGFGAGVNAGARQLSTDWILVMNPDCRFRGADALALAARAEVDGAAIIAPVLREPGGGLERSWGKRDTWVDDLVRPLAWRLDWGPARPARPQSVAWVTGACFLVRRSVFESVQGFDERFFLYFEDADLCARVRQGGGAVWIHPGFEASHVRGASSAGQEVRARMAYRASQVLFARRHRPGWFAGLALARARFEARRWNSAGRSEMERECGRELLEKIAGMEAGR